MERLASEEGAQRGANLARRTASSGALNVMFLRIVSLLMAVRRESENESWIRRSPWAFMADCNRPLILWAISGTRS